MDTFHFGRRLRLCHRRGISRRTFQRGRRARWLDDTLHGSTRETTLVAFAGWQMHLSCGGNKLDTCPLNHLNFIIHATACNPFVWRAAGCIMPRRVSNTPRLLYCVTLQPIFHLLGGGGEKGHCSHPALPPLSPPPAMLSFPLMTL